MFRLDGQVAVVTGAASGIGQAVAEMFACHGACVHVLDLNGSQAENVAANIRGAHGSAKAHVCDVSVRENVESIFRRITTEGPIDILVNSAGIAHVGKLENTSEEDFDAVYRVNVKGTYHCMSACIEQMKTRGRGAILNLASIASSSGLPDRFAYSMSKGAVRSMTLSVARDYLAHNIRCNCISPARIHTPFVDGFVRKNYPGNEKEMLQKLNELQPIGRMGEPREVAALALFLCSGQAGFVTGADYPLDGGFLNLR
jgi:NAD(P)-dependent dehydrogenase (short-subunit alcohol dehydrogenase family)